MATLEDWSKWGASLPSDLSNEEQYTATLVLTLERLARTFEHPWGLTGGTCLQSYLQPELRRYSSDLEIITPASEEQVIAWMASQSLKSARVNHVALKCPLTPDGTLFVIHSYPQADFDAADIVSRPFDHFPIHAAPPPGQVQARLISPPYLLATKLWEVQRVGRGGERPKDAYDLARCIGIADITATMDKLVVYARHQGREGDSTNIARRAACYLDWFAGPGFSGFQSWSKRFVPEDAPQPTAEDIAAAARLIASVLGERPTMTAKEQCEFLIRDLTPKDLVPIAERLGMDKKRLGQYDNVKDYVLLESLDKLDEPYPTNPPDLLAALRKAVGL